jgi:hypothetical protein
MMPIDVYSRGNFPAQPAASDWCSRFSGSSLDLLFQIGHTSIVATSDSARIHIVERNFLGAAIMASTQESLTWTADPATTVSTQRSSIEHWSSCLNKECGSGCYRFWHGPTRGTLNWRSLFGTYTLRQWNTSYQLYVIYIDYTCEDRKRETEKKRRQKSLHSSSIWRKLCFITLKNQSRWVDRNWVDLASNVIIFKH